MASLATPDPFIWQMADSKAHVCVDVQRFCPPYFSTHRVNGVAYVPAPIFSIPTYRVDCDAYHRWRRGGYSADAISVMEYLMIVHLADVPSKQCVPISLFGLAMLVVASVHLCT